jgi:hypothetical protein
MRIAEARVSACTGSSAIERIGAFGLDDADLRHAVDKAKMHHLGEALAQRGAVGQIAARNDDVVRNLPLSLLQDLESWRLLALKPVGIDRVQEVDRSALDDLGEHANAAVEVGAELEGG